MDKLCDLVTQVLKSNQDLSRRLPDLETGPRKPASEKSTINIEANCSTPGSVVGDTGAHDNNAMATVEPASVIRNSHGFAFEEDLQRSKVYRDLYHLSDACSISSAHRSTALSINSALSLADVSNISVFALPILATDISNSSWYTFGDGGATIAIRTSDEIVAGAAPASTSLRRRFGAAFRLTRERDKVKPGAPVEASTSSLPSMNRRLFEVPIQVSIRYANVPVSLLDPGGSSYIYGYVPIMVAKVGVFLKEIGTCELQVIPSTHIVTYHSPRDGKYLCIEGIAQKASRTSNRL